MLRLFRFFQIDMKPSPILLSFRHVQCALVGIGVNMHVAVLYKPLQCGALCLWGIVAMSVNQP